MIIWPLLCVGLYLTSFYSYILFHIVAESFSIVIAFSLFMIAWNTRHLTKNNYILFIGIAFLFAGLIDFVHTLAYKGMGIFIGYDANLPTQLWIIARYLQSISLLVAPWFIDRKLNPAAIFGFYLSATILLLAAVFSGTLFPDCFIEGKGLTPFKVASEYIICLILMCSLALLFRCREKFDPEILKLIALSILCTIISELAFTFYISVYALSNLIGHFFKIFSFYLVYQAIIVTGLKNPYSLLFHDLQKSHEELQIIMDSSPIMIFYKNDENTFIRVNKALAEASGLSKEAMEGKTVFEIYPNQAKDYWEDDKEVIASGKPKIGIIEPIDAVTGLRWVQTDKIPYRDEKGRIRGIVGFAVDITDIKKAEEALRESEERTRAITDSAQDAILMMDNKGRISYWNPAAESILGYTSAEAIGQILHELIVPAHYLEAHRTALPVFQQTGQGAAVGKTLDLEACRKDGKEISVQLSLSAVQMKGAWHAVGILRDISERKLMEEKILSLSITDELTGLHNRRGFLSLAEQQLKLAERNKSVMLLFFADLDGLKWINDTLGHEEGDRALTESATVLKETFRTSDIIARLGGDEFAALAVDITAASSAIFTARLQSLIDTRNNQENRRYRLSISVGCSYYDPEHPCSIDELMASADKLMYEQKQNKKSLLLHGASLSNGNLQ